MSKEPYYKSDNPNRWGWAAVRWYVIGAVVILVVGVGFWAFRVATSDVKGRGDAIVQKNKGTNRIAAQERFESLYQNVISGDQRIDAQAAALKAAPKSNVALANFNGSVNYCIQAVADYNAEARKYTAREFRAVDLPEQIDSFDPATDCKETQK